MSNERDGSRPASRGGLAFGPLNYAVLAAGIVAVIGGYVLLDSGSVTAAPILLVLGYAVLLPAGILLGWRSLGRGPSRDEDPAG